MRLAATGNLRVRIRNATARICRSKFETYSRVASAQQVLTVQTNLQAQALDDFAHAPQHLAASNKLADIQCVRVCDSRIHESGVKS